VSKVRALVTEKERLQLRSGLSLEDVIKDSRLQVFQTLNKGLNRLKGVTPQLGDTVSINKESESGTLPDTMLLGSCWYFFIAGFDTDKRQVIVGRYFRKDTASFFALRDLTHISKVVKGGGLCR
jgi:hypothetical protein